MKKSIPYSQALHISNICIETKEVTKHLSEIKEAFLNRGSQETPINDQFNGHHHQKQKTKKKEKSTQISWVMTFNQTLPNFRKVLSENWSLLKINNRLKHAFKEQPIIP